MVQTRKQQKRASVNIRQKENVTETVQQSQIRTPERHSALVGGSTAARVIQCPGSLLLSRTVPQLPASSYAREGTLLHNAAAVAVQENLLPEDLEGFVCPATGLTLTKELLEEKLIPAIKNFDAYLDAHAADTAFRQVVEAEVSFGEYISDGEHEAFGSCDVLLRLNGTKAAVIDWKFGDGVPVAAEKNPQLLFYAAAAMRDPKTSELFRDVKEVELVIIQNTNIRTWLTSPKEIANYERTLKRAVGIAINPGAPLREGAHCRWCPAQAVCPLTTSAVEKALSVDLDNTDISRLGRALSQAALLEEWIAKLRQLAQLALENGRHVPGWKLVNKRAIRRWGDERSAASRLAHLYGADVVEGLYEKRFLSPAQAEKQLKKLNLTLPDELVEKKSSGTTLAPEDDPRPAAALIGSTLAALAAKIH